MSAAPAKHLCYVWVARAPANKDLVNNLPLGAHKQGFSEELARWLLQAMF